MYTNHRPQAVQSHTTGVDAEYDYNADLGDDFGVPTPTSASAYGMQQNQTYQRYASTDDYADELLDAYGEDPEQHAQNKAYDYEDTDAQQPEDPTDDALLDLAQLEELHHEAERMKAVGNKHMAAQEYVKAYNAYSAALQLSPVGPSSHVFLSNRAAALLSLKRYPAAATDARRAVALAPTFGKAHARLGQALYFLKDYAQAVSAYEDAVAYEPDNAVTTAYLQKARLKLDKQDAKQRGEGSGAASVVTAESSMLHASSIATDPAGQHTMVARPYSTKDEEGRAALAHATLPNTNTSPPTTSGAAPTALNRANNSHNSNNTSNISSVYRSSIQDSALEPDDDPEFQEALRIQQRANQFLVHKQYRQAIEEYTAALFLVPDDVQLSPDLHLGRAHALNGSRRHESAKNDAMLALKLQPESPAAYSTLAKSLFYLRDFSGAVEAFASCQDNLPEGEQLGLFDQAYLEKAERAILENEASLPTPTKGVSLSTSSISPVPKLPPPRFVPREDAINQPTTSTTAAARSMPKQWPQQNSSRVPLKVGPEREVMCLTEALGIKLNRGTDGIVRVLSVTSSRDADHVLRKGDIAVGDVVREAAGVDMRRPMTNIMWGDTVALIKMAPRPIVILVAAELSPVPAAVLEEQRRVAADTQARHVATMERPSPCSGDEPVQQPTTESEPTIEPAIEPTIEPAIEPAIEPITEPTTGPITEPTIEITTFSNAEANAPTLDAVVSSEDDSFATADEVAPEPELEEEGTKPDTNETQLPPVNPTVLDTKDETEDDDDIVEVEEDAPSKPRKPKVSAAPTLDTVTETLDEEKSTPASSFDMGVVNDDDDDDGIESVEEEPSPTQPGHAKSKGKTKARVKDDIDAIHIPPSLRDEEERTIGGEILFLRDSPPSYGGWDTLRWMSYNGVRKVNFSQPVHRLNSGAKKRKGLPLFWKTGGSHYEERALIVYDEPRLMLIVRRPANLQEIRQLLGLPDASNDKDVSTEDTDWALNPDTAMVSYWVLESAADPASSKLRLSPLTTSTSVAADGADERERSCFQLLTPTETIQLSAVNMRAGAKRGEQSFSDSGAFLETLSVEASISQVICGAHCQGGDLGKTDTDIAWKHQIIMGSLHSLVLSGNPSLLRDGIAHARMTASRGSAIVTNDRALASRVVDAVDDNGFPALYYACSHRMESAVQALVSAGANVNFRTELNGLTMVHVSARNLDDKSLSTLLSSSSPRPDANAIDKKGRTPMYVAMVEGSVLDNGKDPAALGRCVSALKAWGGTMMPLHSHENLRNPLSALAYMWLPEYMSIVLANVPHRFPLEEERGAATAMSLGALHQYPVHSAIVSLRKQLRRNAKTDRVSPDRLIRTLGVLFEHGFEPNERLDPRAFGSERTSFDEFVGYSPLQILALIALECDTSKVELGDAIAVSCAKAISEVALYLVSCGARLSMEPPLASRVRSKAPDSTIQETETNATHRIEILTQKLESDKHVLSLLGGEDRINAVRKEWLEMKKVATTTTKNLVDDSATVENAFVAGGSDTMSCAICWSVFGTLMNRKHKCRVTNRYVCDECSAKRLVQVTSEHRLSDGQFLLARADAVNEEKERATARTQSNSSRSVQSEQARMNVRLERLEAEEASQRDSLFGGMLGAATSFVMGDETQSPKAQPLQGLTASLDQTREALHERGERLAALNDKSAQMVDASSDFAKMATELRKQSEKGFFW